MVPSPLLDFWPPRRKVVVEEEECVSSRGRGTEGPRRRRRVGGTKVAPPPPPPPPPHLMQTDCRGWKRRGGGGGGEKGGWDGMGMGSYGEHTLYYREREMEGDRGKRTCFTLPLQLEAFFRGRAEGGFFAGQMGRRRRRMDEVGRAIQVGGGMREKQVTAIDGSGCRERK